MILKQPIFDNSYSRLGTRFWARALPANAPHSSLIKLNLPLAQELGFDFQNISEETIAEILTGNEILDGMKPIALAYAGHQFGHLSMLGDGRAILLGEIIDKNGSRRDMQLKGSGTTPFSRNGDGKAALGPVMREYIVSEAMFALGVPTTRSLGFVTTGENIWRDNVQKGAILTRIASSHIRVGTFTYFHASRDFESLKILADYAIARHYPQAEQAENKYLEFFHCVMNAQAALIAKWMSIGFIHGVMNTDNMTISGETIDYGPCAFMDEYVPNQLYSSIDRNGRYAFNNQPSIAQWNLARLCEALLPLFDEDADIALALAQKAIDAFPDIYKTHWEKLARAKLGLSQEMPEDISLYVELLEIMHQKSHDFTNVFANLLQSIGETKEDAYKDWHKKWHARLAQENSIDEAQELMQVHNPQIIPRNHQIAKAIKAAEEYDDFSIMEKLIKALSTPFVANEEFSKPPEQSEKVLATFCGT